MIDVTKRLQQLIEAWTPELRKAFLDAIAAMGASVDLNRLVAELAKGDIDAAVREVNLDPLQFRGLETVMTAAYDAGGNDAVAQLPPVRGPAGHKLLVLFDGRNERAERWIRNQSSTLVREVTADQQVAIRQHLEAGLAAGLNPRTVALSLVGTINPKTRKREGGVLGLTSTQEKWARGYEEELKAGDRAFLKRAMRDRRFDATVLKAIKAGKPLSPQQIATMVAAYRARALKYRADTLARTEAISALNQSQMESMQQAVDSGKVQQRYITKTWHSAGDHRVRLTHQMLNGTRVPFATKFTSESGAKLAYPGDPTAPAAERINCFVPETPILRAGLKGVITRHYSGIVVKLLLAKDISVTVTPNHPVLTQRGWIAASQLLQDDKLVYCSTGVGAGIQPDVDHGYASAESLCNLAQLSGTVYRPVSAAVNLHGEIPQSQVEVISLPRSLGGKVETSISELLSNLSLHDTDVAHGLLLYRRLTCQRSIRIATLAANAVSNLRACLSVLKCGVAIAQRVSLRAVSLFQTQVLETGFNFKAPDAQFFGHGQNGFAAGMQRANAIKQVQPLLKPITPLGIEIVHYDGPVYNFETESGLIVANGLVTHNCRCWMQIKVDYIAMLADAEAA